MGKQIIAKSSLCRCEYFVEVALWFLGGRREGSAVEKARERAREVRGGKGEGKAERVTTQLVSCPESSLFKHLSIVDCQQPPQSSLKSTSTTTAPEDILLLLPYRATVGKFACASCTAPDVLTLSRSGVARKIETKERSSARAYSILQTRRTALTASATLRDSSRIWYESFGNT